MKAGKAAGCIENNPNHRDQLSEVKRKILQVEYDVSSEVELPLMEEEKGEWRQNQKAYVE